MAVAFTQTHGPSVRHLLDMADPWEEGKGGEGGESKWVLPLGQEGDLLSPLYDSQLEKWGQGSYITMYKDAWDKQNGISMK